MKDDEEDSDDEDLDDLLSFWDHHDDKDGEDLEIEKNQGLGQFHFQFTPELVPLLARGHGAGGIIQPSVPKDLFEGVDRTPGQFHETPKTHQYPEGDLGAGFPITFSDVTSMLNLDRLTRKLLARDVPEQVFEKPTPSQMEELKALMPQIANVVSDHVIAEENGDVKGKRLVLARTGSGEKVAITKGWKEFGLPQGLPTSPILSIAALARAFPKTNQVAYADDFITYGRTADSCTMTSATGDPAAKVQ